MTCQNLKLLILFICLWNTKHAASKKEHYTNTWAVKIKKGPEVAKQVAIKYGFTFIGSVGSLEDSYIFQHKKVARRSRRSSRMPSIVLKIHPQVIWAQQQAALNRRKRFQFYDPLYRDQWYLQNVGQADKRCNSGPDINVLPVWKKRITGEGSVVAIVDDGLELTHPDLNVNYDAEASHDFNDNDNDPTPRYTANGSNKHGTRCAGEVAAAKNNGKCGVGVAFRAKVFYGYYLQGFMNKIKSLLSKVAL